MKYVLGEPEMYLEISLQARPPRRPRARVGFPLNSGDGPLRASSRGRCDAVGGEDKPGSLGRQKDVCAGDGRPHGVLRVVKQQRPQRLWKRQVLEVTEVVGGRTRTHSVDSHSLMLELIHGELSPVRQPPAFVECDAVTFHSWAGT